MSEDAGSIYAEVRIRIDQLTSDLRTATTKIDAFEKQTSATSTKASANFSKINIGAVAMAAGIGAAFRSMITTSNEYTTAMSKVQAATRASTEEMEAFAKAAKEAGDSSKYSATEALAGVEALAKAGVSTKDILGGGLQGALALAAAGELSVGDAAEAAASAMTQFGLSGTDVTHIADLLAAGAGKAQGEVSDMVAALKQSGLVAAQMGLSIESTTGALAAFASAGLTGSDAGTSFKAMLLRLAAPTKESTELFKKYGIAAYDANGSFVGLSSLAEQLKTKLGGLTSEQRNSTLATVFGTDAIRAANVLYNQGAKGIDEWTKKVNDQGYAAETAAIMMDNLAGDQKKLDSSLKNLSNTLVGEGNPAMRAMTQVLTTIVKALSEMPGPLAAIITAIGAVAGVFGAGAAAAGIFGITISAALLPVIAIVAGVTAAIAGVTAGIIALNAEVNKVAVEKFSVVAESFGLAGAELQNFNKQVADVQSQLQQLDKYAKTPEELAAGFKAIAKSAGLSVEQVAAVAQNSSLVSKKIKEAADDFYSFEKRITAFNAKADKNNRSVLDNVKAVKTVTGASTDAIEKQTNAVSDAIAYQNYLVKEGLQTEEEALNNKIKIREEEIKKIEELGGEAKFLNDTQIKEIQKLISFNEENKESLAQLGAEKEWWATRGQEQAKTELDQIIEFAKANGATEKDIDTIKQAYADKDKARKAKAAKDTKKLFAEQLADVTEYASKAESAFSGLISAISELYAAQNEAQQEALDTQYEAATAEIEAELQAKLEAAGLAEQTDLEAAQTALETAIAGGDAETIAEAQDEVERQQIYADAAAAQLAIDTAYEQSKAQLEYEAEQKAWEAKLASAIATGAMSVLSAFNAGIQAGGPYGLAVGAVFAGIAAATSGIQIAAVSAAKPVAPSFATGGLVIGSSTSSGAMVNVAENGGNELLLNSGASGESFLNEFADKIAARVLSQSGAKDITFIANINSKTIATAVAREFNNGTVKVDL